MAPGVLTQPCWTYCPWLTQPTQRTGTGRWRPCWGAAVPHPVTTRVTCRVTPPAVVTATSSSSSNREWSPAACWTAYWSAWWCRPLQQVALGAALGRHRVTPPPAVWCHYPPQWPGTCLQSCWVGAHQQQQQEHGRAVGPAPCQYQPQRLMPCSSRCRRLSSHGARREGPKAQQPAAAGMVRRMVMVMAAAAAAPHCPAPSADSHSSWLGKRPQQQQQQQTAVCYPWVAAAAAWQGARERVERTPTLGGHGLNPAMHGQQAVHLLHHQQYRRRRQGQLLQQQLWRLRWWLGVLPALCSHPQQQQQRLQRQSQHQGVMLHRGRRGKVQQQHCPLLLHA